MKNSKPAKSQIDRLQDFLPRMLVFMYRHKVFTASVFMLFIALAVWGISRTKMETDTRNFLPRNTQERRISKKINQLYNIDSQIILAYSAEGKSINDPAVMQSITSLVNELKSLKIDKEETPLSAEAQPQNPKTQQKQEATEVELSDLLGSALTPELGQQELQRYTLLQDIQALHTLNIMQERDGALDQLQIDAPQSPAEERKLQKDLREWGLYDQLLYDKEFRYGAIIMQPRWDLSSDEHRQLYDKIATTLEQYDEHAEPKLHFFLSGEGVIQSLVGKYIMQSLTWLTPLTALVICLILYWHFRNLWALLITLLPVAFSTVMTIGLMGLLGIKLSFIHATIPIIIMALGSADSIHMLSNFLQQSKKKGRFRRIAATQKLLFKPISLTSITTSIGFLAFVSSVMVPIRSFGLFSAVGISFAWAANALFLTPLLLALYRPSKKQRIAEAQISPAPTPEPLHAADQADLATRAMARIQQVLLRQPILSRVILVVFAAALLLAIPYVPVNNDTIGYFRSSSKLVQDSNVINKELGGVYNLDISLHSEQVGGAAEPVILQYMADLGAYVEKQNPKVVTQSIGLQDFVMRINALFNPETQSLSNLASASDSAAPPRPSLPEDRQEVMQYLSLFSGNLDSFVSPDIFNAQDARISIYLNTSQKETLEKVLSDIEKFRRDFLPKGFRQEVGGFSILVNSMNQIVVREQVQSIIIAMLGVFLIVWLCYRSFKIGILATLPCIITFLMNLSLMAVFRIDLNISTALINSLIIGVGIDYSIHFLSSYQHNLQEKRPIYSSLKQVSSCIMVNAFSVGLGYSTLLLSQFRSLAYFGGLSALANIIAAILALVVLPFILGASRISRVSKASRMSKASNASNKQMAQTTQENRALQAPKKLGKAQN